MKNWLVRSLGKNGEAGNSAQIGIVIALVLGLSIGFVDITISILSRSPALSSFSSILAPLVAATSVAFLTYIVSWFLLFFPIQRFLKLEAIPLAVSLASFLGIVFVLELRETPWRPPLDKLLHLFLSPTDLLKLFVPLSLSLLFSIGVYFAAKVVSRASNYKNPAIVFSLATPFVLAQMVVFIWLHQYGIVEFHSIAFLFVSIPCVVINLLAIRLLCRIGPRIKGERLLGVFMILLLVSPVVALAIKRGFSASLDRVKQRDHQIKRVILITVDTLRSDVLSCYGRRQGISTPHIDQLASDGLLFAKAISASPWTVPAVASIMTGLSPKTHMTVRDTLSLPDTLPTLAEYMRDAGYLTAAIGSNAYLGLVSDMSRGFLEYNFFPKSTGNSFGARTLKRLFPDHLGFPTTHRLTNLATNWLESNYEEDFFLWLHYLDPHIPYAPPADFLPRMEPPAGRPTFLPEFLARDIRIGKFVPSVAEKKWIRNVYLGEVHYVDDNIGRLLDTLKRLNIYDESLIILTSDHGEEFWEHSGYEHGHTLYDELLWVPLIIKVPLFTSKGRVTTVVSTESIMGTVLDLCGIDYDRDYFSSKPLASLGEPNPNAFEEEPIVSMAMLYGEEREAVTFDGMKYIRSLRTNSEELYDLARDPKERISIVSSSPDKVERARNILREHNKMAEKLRRRFEIGSRKGPKLDEETRRALKSLGYTQ